MTTNQLRTSEEWSEIFNVKVVDPDGWDRRNFAEDWAKPITADEFKAKLSGSTVDGRYYHD